MTSSFGASGLFSRRLSLVGATTRVTATAQIPEERVSRPFESFAGSAVIPVAKAIIQPDWLLDELELRLTRCVPTPSPVLRIGSVLPAGESLHRIATFETRSWWNELGLAEMDGQAHRRILEAMLERSPLYLGWATVPLLSGYLEEFEEIDVLVRVVEWITASDSVDRMVRDAVALGVVVPWLEREDASLARQTIVSWGQSRQPAKIRMGLMAAAAYIRGASAVDPVLERALLDACWRHAPRVDTETAMAVGWTLRELLKQDPARVLPELIHRVGELSRQAMRTAVEGLPRETRAKVTSKWLERIRRGSSRAAPSGPTSAACVRRVLKN